MTLTNQDSLILFQSYLPEKNWVKFCDEAMDWELGHFEPQIDLIMAPYRSSVPFGWESG